MEVIRQSELEPKFHTPKAKEPGYIRWMTTHIGGGPGYINSNPEQSIISDNIVFGMMGFPAAQKQYGLHAHTVTEIFVVLKGEMTSFDGNGGVHRAGPLDCIVLPPGCYHGLANLGREDVLVLVIHDRLERKGSAQYTDESRLPCPAMQLVSFRELEPNWQGHMAKQTGYLRWLASWLGGFNGLDFHPGQSIKNEHAALGFMGMMPYNKQPRHRNESGVVYFVAQGNIAVSGPGGREEIAGLYDTIYVPPGEEHAVRNVSGEIAHIVWMHDKLVDGGHTVWLEE